MVFNVVAREFSKIDKYDSVIDKLGGTLDDDVLHSKALSQSGLTTAVYEYITSLGVSSAAEMTFSQKLKLTTIALKEQAAAFLASPLGKAVIIGAAIFAVVKIIDAVKQSVEEAREALAELGEEFKENESKLQELNGELETTADRIAELEGKDTLTFTEAEELQNLKKQNNELEREIALLETIQRIKSQERNATFVETMEKDLGNAKEYTQTYKYATLTCYDGNGKTLSSLRQWDTNQRLVVKGVELSPVPEFHFCNNKRKNAFVVQPTVSNDSASALIPNVLLQQCYPVIVYLYYPGRDESYKTSYVIRIPVFPRPRPDDYEYPGETDHSTCGLSITSDGKGNVKITTGGTATITSDGDSHVTIR